MRAVRNGEISTYELPLTYTYVAVPMILLAEPSRVSVQGGSMILVTGGLTQLANHSLLHVFSLASPLFLCGGWDCVPFKGHLGRFCPQDIPNPLPNP